MKKLALALAMLLAPMFGFGQTSGLPAPSIAATGITTWANGTTYPAGQVIVYQGVVYQSLSSGNVGHNPVSSPAYWSLTLLGPGPNTFVGNQLYGPASAATTGVLNNSPLLTFCGDYYNGSSLTDCWTVGSYLSGTTTNPGGQLIVNHTGASTGGQQFLVNSNTYISGTFGALTSITDSGIASGNVVCTTTAGLFVGCGTPLTNPMTSPGDIIIGGASGAPVRLPANSSGQGVLTSTAGSPPQTTWSQNLTLQNIQAQNTEVIPYPAAPSGGDDYTALQTAINASIAEGRVMFLPCGAWKTSQMLVASSTSFKLHGCGTGTGSYDSAVGGNYSSIAATSPGYTTLQVGAGYTWEAPQGWTKDIFISGASNWYTQLGFAALQLSGTVQYSVENVGVSYDDIGIDLINNCFGTQFSNNRSLASQVNVGLNLRTGTQSGSDLPNLNNWFGGAVAAISISPNGGGYHFAYGQLTAQAASYCDTCGAIIIGKDYLTGATGGASADFYKVSFEAVQNAWTFRTFGQPDVDVYGLSVNSDGSSGHNLGFLKATSFGHGHLGLHDTELEGAFANTISQCPLASVAGLTTGANIFEDGTHEDVSLSICGTFGTIQSIFAQSGIQQYATITNISGISLPGTANTTPLTLINDNSGNLQTSPSSGCFTGGTCLTYPVATLPSGSQPYDLSYTNTAATSLARIPGNVTATDQVLVSHGQGGTPAAQTYTCGAFNSGSATSVPCTWSTSPTAGMFVACQVTNANNALNAFTVTDSASNVYSPYGPTYVNETNGDDQTFYFGPLTGTITTTTVTSSPANFLGLKCNAVTNVLPVTDGQCRATATASTAVTCSTPIVTTTNADYIFCGAIAASGTFTAGSGFTLGSIDYGPDSANQYQIQATAGSITPSITNSAAVNANMSCSAFKSQAAQAPTLKNAPALSTANMLGVTQSIGDNTTHLATDQFVLANSLTNPMTTLGDLTYGGVSGAATRLPGNQLPIDDVLVSRGTTGTTASTTKTCTNSGVGSASPITCTWSTAPVAGETVVCGLYNVNGFGFTGVTDSGSNTYVLLGSPHAATTLGNTTQAAVFGPLTSTITTTSVSSSTPNYLTIQCQTATNVTATSPLDVQSFADTTGTSTISTGPLTTTVPGDYIFCDAHNSTVGDTFSAGSGFTAGSSFNINNYAQYKVDSSAGTITPSITASMTSPATMACTALKSATPSAAPTLTNTPALSTVNMISSTYGATDTSTHVATDLFVQNAESSLIITNVHQFGAIGNGSSHPACTTLGLGNLTALQAYNGGMYSFATACSNEMDWLATQAALNKVTGSGGAVKMSAGTYVFDQTLVFAVTGMDYPDTSVAMTLEGDGEGATFIVPSVPDFGANTALMSCGPTTASYADNGGSGSGRYTGAACPVLLQDFTAYDPYVAGTVNVTSTSYARGVINVPAPRNSVTGNPIQMDGIDMGGRMYMNRVGFWDFRMAMNIVGDHMAWSNIQAPNSFCGMYFAPQSIYLEADLVMYGHNFVNGNTVGGLCADKDAQINIQQTGELYVGFQPYGFFKFPGTVDSYLGSGYFGFLEGGSYQNIQAEATGNAVIWDDNLTNSAGGIESADNGASISGTTFSTIFATWDSGLEITTGGRGEYAWIGAADIMGLTLGDPGPFSCCGSFWAGGAGQIAGIISGYNGGGGAGISITGSMGPAGGGLWSQYTTMPYIGSMLSGYCTPTVFHQSGYYDAANGLLDPSVTSVAAGQLLKYLPGGTLGISDGTAPVVGVALQSLTNSGAGICLAYIYSGSPQINASTAAPGGNIMVAAAGGNAVPLGPNGGYIVGTATNGGTTPYMELTGMGGYIAGTPMTTLGDTTYGGTVGAPQRLPGNLLATDTVYVSHGSGNSGSSPTTKTCGNYVNSSGTATCTWSTPPAIGESIVCGVSRYGGGSGAFALSDSALNLYNAVGSYYNTTASGRTTQTFYTTPVATSPTTTTVTTAFASQESIMCNTVNALATSSPVDGQCNADASGASTPLSCASVITTTVAKDYIFCSADAQVTGSATFAAGSGFTLGSVNGSGFGAAEYEVQSSAGSITPTISFTGSGLGGVSMTCTALKPSSTGYALPPQWENAPAISLSNALVTVTTITASGTPAITSGTGLQTITLSANAVPTITGIAAGQKVTFQICQPSSGGPYTWTWPAAIHGGITIGTTANTCSMQTFDSFNGTTLVPENVGVVNVAP